MEHLNEVIANNLRELREKKKLSLDKLASLTGVSKSMLGQIERGESNPTITTVWKIANGLKVSFTSLINEPESNHIIVTKDDVEPMIEDHGKFKLFPLFPYRDDQHFEVFIADMEKGAYITGEAHGEGSYEVITVFKGEVTMRIGDEELIVPEGGGMRFKADKPHIYHNTSPGDSQINIIIYYNER